MAVSELDGILIFKQESMFYLTGYDSFGYVFFQCLFLGGDGKLIFIDPRTRFASGTEHVHPRRYPDLGGWTRSKSCFAAQGSFVGNMVVLEKNLEWNTTLMA